MSVARFPKPTDAIPRPLVPIPLGQTDSRHARRSSFSAVQPSINLQHPSPRPSQGQDPIDLPSTPLDSNCASSGKTDHRRQAVPSHPRWQKKPVATARRGPPAAPDQLACLTTSTHQPPIAQHQPKSTCVVAVEYTRRHTTHSRGPICRRARQPQQPHISLPQLVARGASLANHHQSPQSAIPPIHPRRLHPDRAGGKSLLCQPTKIRHRRAHEHTAHNCCFVKPATFFSAHPIAVAA